MVLKTLRINNPNQNKLNNVVSVKDSTKIWSMWTNKDNITRKTIYLLKNREIKKINKVQNILYFTLTNTYNKTTHSIIQRKAKKVRPIILKKG